MENIKTSLQSRFQRGSVDRVKACRKCGAILSATAENFYRNPRGKFGLTPRCKPCVDEDNKESHARRLARDPEKVRAQASDRTRRYYQRNLDKSRAKARAYAKARHAADPGLKRRAKLKLQYGMTPEQWQAMFEAQGCRCAICRSDNPNAKAGWNTDHCHKTGLVRFILCAHCNRGLGAFMDDPALMRRAADMLEEIQAGANRAPNCFDAQAIG